MSTLPADRLAEKERALLHPLQPFRDLPALLLDQLIEQGSQLPPLTPEQQRGAVRIPGCRAEVSLYSWPEGERLFFAGSSSALLTRGLLALLVLLYSGERAEQIAAYMPTFPEQMGLQRLIGRERRDGFAAMLAAFQQQARRML